MTGWSEQTLRQAASWKSFKEGKALMENGAVTEAKVTTTGWQGTVLGGKKPLKVNVIVKSATDLQTRCPCPINQSSGEICSHAVASGLAALAGLTAKPSTPAQNTNPASGAIREITFPPRWRDALARGTLAATLTKSARNLADDADFRLSDWLSSSKVADTSVIHIHLDANRSAGFLDAIVGHSEVFIGKERTALEISSGHRFQLASASLSDGQVTFVPWEKSERWQKIGKSYWQTGEFSLIRSGRGEIPTSLAELLEHLVAGKSLSLPVAKVLAQLDAWQDWLAFPADSWLEALHFAPATADFELSLEGSLQHLDAKLRVIYSGASPTVPGIGVVSSLPRFKGDHCEVRNWTAEEQAVYGLENAGFLLSDRAAGTWAIRDSQSVLDFLSRTLPKLRKRWTILEGERFTVAHQKLAIVSPKIEILGSGEDWLSFDLKFQTDDGIQIPKAEIHQMLRSRKQSGQARSGRHLFISDDVVSLIEPLFSELDLKQNGGHYESSALAGEVIQGICRKLHNSLDANEAEDAFAYRQASTLRASLRPYQQHGSAWLQNRIQRFGGALLADDMGLGKTIQTIALIENLFLLDECDNGVVLIVASTSLLSNWRAEFGRFAPQRIVRILHGTSRDKEREKVMPGEVILTSFGTLARDLAWHLRCDYRAVVVDEASMIRNPDTDHAKALVKLRTKRRIALTGTPLENGVRDLWSIFRFIQPGWLGGREEFRERYEAPLASGELSAGVMERLRFKISPLLLRRTKEEVAPELPSKLFIDEFCDLSRDQRAVYRDLLAEGRRQVESISDSGNQAAARMRMLTTLLRLRQTCCDLALLQNDRLNSLPEASRSSKMERLMELLEEAVNGGHRVLIFSQFQRQLLKIGESIEKRSWQHLRLDGQTRKRQELVDQFQQTDGPPLFLISLKAGGYGLNLTAADTVIHFDPWWNPAAEAQATDRAHRIGQTRPVTIYRLLTRGTVEEQVVRLQQKKRELAAAIDEGGAGDAPGWSTAELKSLISESPILRPVE